MSIIKTSIETAAKKQERCRKFVEHLNCDILFKRITSFFSHLFTDTDKSGIKPVAERCYIIITRKGFALWHAGILCGLIDEKMSGTDRLMSDRCWRKMTNEERKKFIQDRHVFIADDSVRLGNTAKEIYDELPIGSNAALTREFVVLTSEHLDYSEKFDSFKNFGSVTTPERRNINNKIMFALYKLGIPFAAESPVYQLQLTSDELNKFESADNGWEYQKMPLDFEDAGIAQNVFFMSAPPNPTEYGSNVKTRGMRMCTVQNEDGTYTAIFIPWIAFEAMDYTKASTYLIENAKRYVQEKHGVSWLFDQLTQTSLDCKRRKSIVYRVMSYLIHNRVVAEFEGAFGCTLSKYEAYDWDIYHFADTLRKEMIVLSDELLKDRGVYPTVPLYMAQEEYDNLSAELAREESISKLKSQKVCNQRYTFDALKAEMCFQREFEVEESTWRLVRQPVKLIPLISCEITGFEFGLLECYRKAVLALKDVLSEFSGRKYLLSVCSAGEGSYTVLTEHYPFIYALRHYYSKPNNSMSLPEFAREWDNKVRVNPVIFNEYGVKMPNNCADLPIMDKLIKMSSAGWPDDSKIRRKFAIGHDGMPCRDDEVAESPFLSEVVRFVDEIVATHEQSVY